MTKKCSRCKNDKPLIEFNKKGKYLSSYCKSCHSEYVNEHYKKNKSKYIQRNKDNHIRIKSFVDELKSKSKCTKCGENHPATLQFHHLEAKNKEFSISTAVQNNLSIQKIKEEIDKCIILCANCHFKLHWELES